MYPCFICINTHGKLFKNLRIRDNKLACIISIIRCWNCLWIFFNFLELVYLSIKSHRNKSRCKAQRAQQSIHVSEPMHKRRLVTIAGERSTAAGCRTIPTAPRGPIEASFEAEQSRHGARSQRADTSWVNGAVLGCSSAVWSGGVRRNSAHEELGPTASRVCLPSRSRPVRINGYRDRQRYRGQKFNCTQSVFLAEVAQVASVAHVASFLAVLRHRLQFGFISPLVLHKILFIWLSTFSSCFGLVPGLWLGFQPHVSVNYRRGAVLTMLDSL